jgi:D-alanyl-D-alanine carboxypeptidase
MKIGKLIKQKIFRQKSKTDYVARYLVLGFFIILIAVLNPLVINEITLHPIERGLLGDVYDARLPARKEGAGPAPIVTAGSALVVDRASGRFIYHKNVDEVRPIASITKLLTALVFLDQEFVWQDEYAITRQDQIEDGSRVYFRQGEKLTLNDIFKSMLIASANNSALALVHSTGKTEEEFADLMNMRARALGMNNLKVSETTGLSPKNVATAADVAKLFDHAIAQQNIYESLIVPELNIRSLSGFEHKIVNTDKLLTDEDSVIQAGKTGFLPAAGYCFVGLARGTEGQELIIVVLGSESVSSRLAETEELAEWALDNYLWN